MKAAFQMFSEASALYSLRACPSGCWLVSRRVAGAFLSAGGHSEPFPLLPAPPTPYHPSSPKPAKTEKSKQSLTTQNQCKLRSGRKQPRLLTPHHPGQSLFPQSPGELAAQSLLRCSQDQGLLACRADCPTLRQLAVTGFFVRFRHILYQLLPPTSPRTSPAAHHDSALRPSFCVDIAPCGCDQLPCP